MLWARRLQHPAREGAMGRGGVRVLAAVILAALAILAGSQAPAAWACSIDGVASLSGDGELATPSGAPQAGSDLRRWAPFTLLAVAPDDPVRLAEDSGTLRGVLPAWAFAKPFLWRFDDGATA